MQKIIVLKQKGFLRIPLISGFGFFHDGINLEKKPEHHNQGCKCDSAETEYHIFVENIWIRAFTTGHQSKTEYDDT